MQGKPGFLKHLQVKPLNNWGARLCKDAIIIQNKALKARETLNYHYAEKHACKHEEIQINWLFTVTDAGASISLRVRANICIAYSNILTFKFKLLSYHHATTVSNFNGSLF